MRAVETTEIILKMHPNPPPQVHKYEEFEEMYFGDMEGKSYDPNHPGTFLINFHI